jgi:superfamily II DNA or RNA helicase
MIVTSIWDTGANFPELSDIYRADPLDGGYIKDTQAPGRGSRLYEGKEYASLNDTVDRFDERLYDTARRKRSNYKSQGWDEVGWLTRDQTT